MLFAGALETHETSKVETIRQHMEINVFFINNPHSAAAAAAQSLSYKRQNRIFWNPSLIKRERGAFPHMARLLKKVNYATLRNEYIIS
jgi:hypothetical protein